MLIPKYREIFNKVAMGITYNTKNSIKANNFKSKELAEYSIHEPSENTI